MVIPENWSRTPEIRLSNCFLVTPYKNKNKNYDNNHFCSLDRDYISINNTCRSYGRSCFVYVCSTIFWSVRMKKIRNYFEFKHSFVVQTAKYSGTFRDEFRHEYMTKIIYRYNMTQILSTVDKKLFKNLFWTWFSLSNSDDG